MHESKGEPASARSRKPGRWVWRAAVGVFVVAVLIFGLRVWRFYEAVEAVERNDAYLIVSKRATWLEHLGWDWGRGELFFAEEIGFSSFDQHSLSFLITRGFPRLEDNDLKDVAPYLVELDNLRFLDLTGSGITDKGLTCLGDVHQIESIVFSHTGVSDAGLAHLAGLKNLKELFLDNCNIGDEGLRHLHGLQKLESLNLDGTQVTDEGVRGLKSLKNLRFLSLAATGITDDACEELRGAIPDLEILDD